MFTIVPIKVMRVLMLLFVITFVLMIRTNNALSIKTRRMVMNMNIWNAQKVGQSVVDTSSITPPGTEAAPSLKPFKKVLVGAGNDERPLYGTTAQEEEEANYATLSNIDKYLRQKALLQGLTSGMWSMSEKTERIRLASSYENLLPSTLSAQVISSPSMKAGGLLNEWDF